VKSELQKNLRLSEALEKSREDLKSAARDHTLQMNILEDEKKRIQSQLTTVQRQASTNETALQMANQVSDDDDDDDDDLVFLLATLPHEEERVTSIALLTNFFVAYRHIVTSAGCLLATSPTPPLSLSPSFCDSLR